MTRLMTEWLFDGLLISALLLTALAVLSARDLFAAVVLFIAFGLLMTLCWVRLKAPDVALAEAAIGAGLTGVLLLDAVGHLGRDERVGRPGAVRAGLVIALLLVFAATTAWAVFHVYFAPPVVTEMAAKIAEAQPASGVAQPITAVLLNFRSYDTLLEIAVLVAAGIAGVAAARLRPAEPSEVQINDTLLHALERLLVPVALALSAYLLWAGSSRPGGAFQAAAVLAAIGVLLRLSGMRLNWLRQGLWLGIGMTAGFAVFLAVGIAALLVDAPFLTYPEGWAGSLIIAIEAALTVSIAVIFLALFAAPPVGRRRR